MKIGIFDSGLGGLVIAHSLMQRLPKYDYIYLGDTARVPYGNRSQETVYRFTEQAVDYLFRHDCQLVIIACNTASAEALRQIQQYYLPKHYPDRRVLGVLIPAAEEAAVTTKNNRIGVLATNSTVASGAFVRELTKINPDLIIEQQPAPLLVPLIENNGLKWADSILKEYLQPLIDKDIDCLILGCTHYPILKDRIQQIVGAKIQLISQDELVPLKLVKYLERHQELESRLTQNSERLFLSTDITPATIDLAAKLFGEQISFSLVDLEDLR